MTAVIFGGPSPEHDVSILLGLPTARALVGAGRQVNALYWAKTGDWFEVDPALEAGDFLDGVPKSATPVKLVAGTGGGFVASGRLGRDRAINIEAALMCCHGGPGEDGTLQGVLDLAGIPYTGPTAAGAALGMDKYAFGTVVAALGLPGLPRAVIGPEQGWSPGFDGPYLVKPRFGGSSIGIEVVADATSAQHLAANNVHLRAGAVIEPFREGAEDLNISIRTWPSLALSPIERPVRSTAGAAILDYRDKYVGGEGMASAPRELPAQISGDLASQIEGAARRIATAASVRGVARLDFLHHDGRLYVNEINTIPGSLSKYLWEAATPSVPFATLLTDMLDEAVRRPAHHYTVAGADGTALRSAGTIASKLA